LKLSSDVPPPPQITRRRHPRQPALLLLTHAAPPSGRASRTLPSRLGPSDRRVDLPRPLRPHRAHLPPQTL